MSEVTREDIAAALDGVAVEFNGSTVTLSASTAQPAALAVWQTWPDWLSATWMTAYVIERVWQVFVILPAADAPTWTAATDAVLTTVRNALIPVGHVERVEPIALVAAESSTTMPAVAFTLHTS